MASQDWMNKDFYQALGVSKTASAEEIKAPIANLPANITRIVTLGIPLQKRNSKKFRKHTES